MEYYVSYHKIIEFFKQIQQNSPRLKTMGHGDIVYFSENITGDTTAVYPYMFVTPELITYQESTTNYQFNVIFADIVNTDLSNEIDVISDMSIECKNFIASIYRGFLFDKIDIQLGEVAVPFMERFNDHVGGVYCSLTIIVFDDINACVEYPPPSATPTNTPTPSITPTNTPTISLTPTNTQTPTPSTTTTLTPTPTNTQTPTPTTTTTLTPTPTPSTTTTLTPTPTNTITPSITPTNTITPSVTPSITPTQSQVWYRYRIDKYYREPSGGACTISQSNQLLVTTRNDLVVNSFYCMYPQSGGVTRCRIRSAVGTGYDAPSVATITGSGLPFCPTSC